jgi:hypothetical protein
MSRRVLYHPAYIRGFARALAEAKADLREMHLKHLGEMADLRRELDAARANFTELRNAALAREKAEADLELMKRDRERQTCIAEGATYWLH